MEATGTTAAAGTVGDRTGTVTFLFTDIEGSTRLLQDLGEDVYRGVLAEHGRILRSAIEAEGGEVFGSAGDGLFSAFPSAVGAARAAVAAQRDLASHDWPDGVTVRVRMAIHTGEAVRTGDGDYTGLDLHRVSRVLSVGWGGQVLLSRAAADLVRSEPGLELLDLSEHRLKDLTDREHLFQLCAADLERDFPALRSLDAMPNNLPTPLTSFVGREQELGEVKGLLEAARLLTLTGPGGTGKTRLSLRLAFEVVDRFPDGVFFVDLSGIFEPELVASEILSAVGLPESGSRPAMERLVDHLGGRSVLLVLDNFEQVLDAAGVVSELLDGAADLSVVVTSRVPLHVYGEQEFPVPPLGVPDAERLPPIEELADAEAIALFLERASAIRPGFRLDESNYRAIVEIVRRLDGLPLAIELAAARTRLLPPGAVAERLSDRFELLTGGARDLPSRQQTLRATIDWSWDLLDDVGRCLLARMSVFVGGADLDAVEAVCADGLGGDLLAGLDSLVDHSLIRRRDVDGQPRFDLLETIRAFARQRLDDRGEAPQIRRRHLTYFVEQAEAAEPHLTGPDQNQWLDRLDREHDNLRTALTCAIETDETEAALRIVAALWRFWQIRGHLHEGRGRIEQVLDMPHGDADARLLGEAYEAAGGTAYWMGDFAATRRNYERSLELFRDSGDDRGVAYALYNLSSAYLFKPDEDEPGHHHALEFLDEAITLFERIDDRHGVARALWARSGAHLNLGELEQARNNIESALEVFRELDQPFDVGWALRTLGLVALQQERFDEAIGLFDEALQVFVDVWDVSALVMLLDDFRVHAQERGDVERAVVLFGAKERWRNESGTSLSFDEQQFAEQWDRTPGADLDPDRYDDLHERGAAMSLEEAVDFALDDPLLNR